MIARALYLTGKAVLKEGLCRALDFPLFHHRPFSRCKVRALNRLFGAHLADDCIVWTGVRAVNWRHLTIGAGVYISNRIEFRSHAPIRIGAMSMVGTDTMFVSGGHRKSDLAPTATPIVIGEGVFIGVRALILEGVTIGDHAMIGAGAIVVGDIPARAIAVGSPARVIGYREVPSQIWSIDGMIDLPPGPIVRSLPIPRETCVK